MSGIEILGVAASVLQIADLGAKLSVKLFVFSRKIKNADKSIDSISQDIAATGAVLQLLGHELGRDEHLRLCSDEAVATAQDLVSDCKKIFWELADTLDGGVSGNTVVLGWKQRLKYPFLEAQIELLRSNLERLKSSLVVMLNVLIFAGQLKNQETLEILKDQKELVKVLVEDKNASEKKYRLALKALEYAATAPAPSGATTTATKELTPPTSPTEAAPSILSAFKTNFISKAVSTPIATKANPEANHNHVYSLPTGLRYRRTEIQHHCNLVRNLLDEVSAVQYQIDHGFRDRLQRGVLGVHWEEWAPLRELYGDEALIKAFSTHPEVVRFWVSKLEAEALARPTGRRNILSIRDLTPDEGRVEMSHTAKFPAQQPRPKAPQPTLSSGPPPFTSPASGPPPAFAPQPMRQSRQQPRQSQQPPPQSGPQPHPPWRQQSKSPPPPRPHPRSSPLPRPMSPLNRPTSPPAPPSPPPSLSASPPPVSLEEQPVSLEARPVSPDKSDPVPLNRVPVTISSALSDHKCSLESTENYMSAYFVGRSEKRRAMYEHSPPRNSGPLSIEIENEQTLLPKISNSEYMSPPNATKPSFSDEDRKESGSPLSTTAEAAWSDSTSFTRPEEPKIEWLGQSAAAKDRAERPAKLAILDPRLHSGKDPKPNHSKTQKDPKPTQGKPPLAAVGRVGATLTGLFKKTKQSPWKQATKGGRWQEVKGYSSKPNNYSPGEQTLIGYDDAHSYVKSTLPGPRAFRSAAPAELTESTQSYGLERSDNDPSNLKITQSLRYAPAMGPSTTKPSMAERAKYQLEPDGSDNDDDMNEIEANFDSLNQAVGGLNAFARATEGELGTQNEYLELGSGKSDRIDDDIAANNERLKRISPGESSNRNGNSRTLIFSPALGTYVQPRPSGQSLGGYGVHITRSAAPEPEMLSSRTETDESDVLGAMFEGSEDGESELTPTRAEKGMHGEIMPELALGLSIDVFANAVGEHVISYGSHEVPEMAAQDETDVEEQQVAGTVPRLVPSRPTWSSRRKVLTHEEEEMKKPDAITPTSNIEQTQENDGADALQPHIEAEDEDEDGKGFGIGQGDYAAVDKLLMEWTRLSPDEYEALQNGAGLEL